MQLVEVGAAAGLWPLGSIPRSAAACVGEIDDIFAKVVVPMGGLLLCCGYAFQIADPRFAQNCFL